MLIRIMDPDLDFGEALQSVNIAHLDFFNLLNPETFLQIGFHLISLCLIQQIKPVMEQEIIAYTDDCQDQQIAC